MLYKTIKKYDGILYASELDDTISNNRTVDLMAARYYLSDDPIRAKVQIGMAVSLLSGLFQILFSLLHIGFVTKYFSDDIVNAFSCGSAFHIVVSMISIALGIKPKDTDLPFVLIGVNYICYTFGQM